MSVLLFTVVFLSVLRPFALAVDGCVPSGGDSETCTAIIAETPLGRVRGSFLTTQIGARIYSFRGIPYAEPPTGSNRFQIAEPKKPWGGDILDATKDGKVCPQPPIMFKPLNMSEDCLFINVYSKNLQGKSPVMFFVHGGGFTFGGSHSEVVAGPQYLLNKDIVLVSINYRLGAFGFLSTGSSEAPGNLGLKDMVLALKWVQNNIESFGGDPNSVTIIGHSAGAVAASSLLISPMSKGLFHKVIVMSASVSSFRKSDNQLWTKKLATDAGCIKETNKEILECLRGISWEKLIEVCLNWDKHKIPSLKWNFEIEEDFGQERFFVTDPNLVLENGDYPRVPIMAGTVTNEFEYLGLHIFEDKSLMEKINNHPEVVFPVIFGYNGFQNSAELTKSLREHFFKNKEITKSNLNAFCKMLSDNVITYPVHRFISLVRKNADMYTYPFDYLGKFSEAMGEDGKPLLGVAHADELQYIFQTVIAPKIAVDDPEKKIEEHMVNLWTNFATTGNPNSKGGSLTWVPTNKTTLSTLVINKDLTLLTDVYSENVLFWDSLFPLP